MDDTSTSACGKKSSLPKSSVCEHIAKVQERQELESAKKYQVQYAESNHKARATAASTVRVEVLIELEVPS